MHPRHSKTLTGCAGLACGSIAGLLLGAALGVLHLSLYWHRGGEAAGTEVVLVFVYAIPGTMLGAIAGLIAGVFLARRK